MAPKLIKFQAAPQVTRQPAGPVLTGSVEFILIDTDLERGRGEIRRNRLIAGEEAESLLAMALGVEYLDGFGPGGLLLAVDLPEVEESPLVGGAQRGLNERFRRRCSSGALCRPSCE